LLTWLIFDLVERYFWGEGLELGGGLGLEVWFLFFSFETDFVRRKEIIYGFSPWTGFSLAYSLLLVSIIFIVFSLDNCLMKRSSKET